jgi:hypothetical protein
MQTPNCKEKSSTEIEEARSLEISDDREDKF